MWCYLALVKKELKGHFLTPLVYLMSALFIFIMGWIFFNSLLAMNEQKVVSLTNSVFRPLLGNINFLFIFIIPLLTMKSFSEETKLHTLEVLLTSKLSLLQIILAKLTATFMVMVFMVIQTLIFPLILSTAGPCHWPTLVMGYVGTLLNTFSYIAIGLFFSSITAAPILAALMSFVAILGLLLISNSTLVISNFFVGQIFQYLSTVTHFEGFTRGVAKGSDIIYFLSLIIFMIFLSHESLKSRSW